MIAGIDKLFPYLLGVFGKGLKIFLRNGKKHLLSFSAVSLRVALLIRLPDWATDFPKHLSDSDFYLPYGSGCVDPWFV